MSNCLLFGQKVNTLKINENKEKEQTFLVSFIDSIKLEHKLQLQKLYIGEDVYEYNLRDIESITFMKENLNVFYIPDYIKGTDTYFFSNGCTINISRDSINGFFIIIDSLDFKSNQWDEEKALALYCDSYFRPIMAVTKKGKTQFLYDDINNIINVRSIDLDGNIYELFGINMKNVNSAYYNMRRASTDENKLLDGAINALDIVNIVRSISQRDMNSIYEVLAPRLIPDGIPKDIVLILKDGIETYLEKKIVNKALGLVGVVLDYVQLISDLRDWIVKLEIGDVTPKITNLEQTGNSLISLRIDFSGEGFLTSTNDIPCFHVNYWQEVEGRRVGNIFRTPSKDAKYGYLTESITNLKGGDWAFQVIVYPQKFSFNDFLIDNYNFRSNIMHSDIGRLYISEITQIKDYYADNKVTISVRALLKYLTDEDKVILSAFDDYGLYIKQGNKAPELCSFKQNGSLDYFENFDFTKDEMYIDFNTYSANPKEDIKFGVYTINGFGLRKYYNEQSFEMSYNRKPKAETGGCETVDKTSAIVNCSYEGCAFWNIPCGIEYGYEGKREIGVVVSDFDGEQEIHLTDLTPGKTYTYRAYYEVNGKKEYGKSETFTTEKGDPIAITGSHYNETTTSATIACTYENVPDLADCGYYISKSIYSDASRRRTISGGVEWNQVSFGTYEGTKTIELSDLMPDEEYEYYAYISVDNEVVATGEKNSFATLRPSAFLIGDAKVEDNSTTIGYGFRNVPEGSRCLLVLLKVGDALENARYIPIPNKVKGDYSISELEESTSYQYFVRIEYKGRMWDSSDTGNFTTKTPDPIVITGDYSIVTMNSATISCTYKYVPKDGICGVEYTWSDGSNRQAVNSINGTQSIVLYGLEQGTTYTYRAYIDADGKSYYGSNKTFTTESSCPDSNHPHLIDLELPSGTLWECCNAGASSPEDYGYFYRMENAKSAPSSEQIKELLSCTTSIWTKQRGKNGQKFMGNNGNSIFLPAAGWSGYDWRGIGYGAGGNYWGSSRGPCSEKSLESLYFTKDKAPHTGCASSGSGLSLRRVSK